MKTFESKFVIPCPIKTPLLWSKRTRDQYAALWPKLYFGRIHVINCFDFLAKLLVQHFWLNFTWSEIFIQNQHLRQKFKIWSNDNMFVTVYNFQAQSIRIKIECFINC